MDIEIATENELSVSVLMIAMTNSIHTARWINQFRGVSMQITLIPSTGTSNVHPMIKDLLNSEGPLKLKVPENFRRNAFLIGAFDNFSHGIFRGIQINRWLRSSFNGFDVVHALELQHAGYVLMRLGKTKAFSRVIVTTWGCDIAWFSRYRRHRNHIKKLLSIATHHSCECQRDVMLASDLGFNGINLPVHPVSGPIYKTQLDKTDFSAVTSSRKMILIKGYTKFVGRADIALKAIELCAAECKEYEVVVFSSDRKSRRIAKGITKKTGLEIKCLKPYEMSHDSMLNLFMSARIYLGVSMSDGISTSLLEAISSGSFPIQTNTSCASEWIEDGVNGFTVDYTNPRIITQKIVEALTNDDLVDRAAKLNRSIAEKRLSAESMISDHLSFYQLK